MQKPSLKRTLRAFTLIELLIVVAIIAILAAIAVPNFLEAQTRAKVSRVKADMRSLSVGVESYIVDNNKVFPTARGGTQTRTFIWGYMTTPIAYMTSVPQDPFNVKESPAENRTVIIWGPDYIDSGTRTVKHRDGTAVPIANASPNTARANIFRNFPDLSNGTDMVRNNFWFLDSWGPDKVYDVNSPTFGSPINKYDPTNGTISSGDIARSAVGGQY